jgi:hypothetical protein
MADNRLLYTRQCSHLNVLGKEILSNQLGTHIFLLLERVKAKPITLKWHDEEIQQDVPSKTKYLLAQMPTQLIPKCNRKLPASRNYDFCGTPKCESIKS